MFKYYIMDGGAVCWRIKLALSPLRTILAYAA